MQGCNKETILDDTTGRENVGTQKVKRSIQLSIM